MQIIEIIFIHPSAIGNHFKYRQCQGICTDHNGIFTLELLQTKKWFDEHKFHLMPGDQLSAPETKRQFTVTDVTYKDQRPKHAIVSATLNQSNVGTCEAQTFGGLRHESR